MKVIKRIIRRIINKIKISLSAGFTVFAKFIVRLGVIPFDLIVDPFYRAENINELKRRIDNLEAGKTKMITMTMEELEIYVNKRYC